jgi:aspartyl protease family protein
MRSRDGCIYVQRSPDGFYNLVGQLNGSHIGFVVEVGARYIVLNQDGAKAAGFPVNLLSYSQRIQTANGQTQVAPIVLERLIVGGIKEQSINAVVAKEGELTTNILGMSFLDKLQSYGVRGEELFMCAYV